MPKITRHGGPTNRYTDPVVEVEPPEPPAKTAGKPAWVAYARAVGVDSTGTKTQIIRRLGL
jgi:hypothetical protein